ncbi:hypothetical protein [Spiroplasma endosymbiont of Dilophus febrilis]|uniref:hypothetical protein n=1 Tax=Spiroplasma endosymbiont of Dilophus febrilis TaxID=3066292 RepID=UPI00313EB26D
MKKILGILGTIITAGSGTLTLVANSPSSIKTEEKILKRSKRWGETQWIYIQNEWKNVEQAYQNAANEFQRTQNHWQFSQAQQHFLQAQQSYNNSVWEWQQGLTQWANEIRNERNQQWWIQVDTRQKRNAGKQWTSNKIDALAIKLGKEIKPESNPVLKNNENFKIKTETHIERDIFKGIISGVTGVIGSIFGGPIAGLIIGGGSYGVSTFLDKASDNWWDSLWEGMSQVRFN